MKPLAALSRLLLALACAASLSACGGGGGSSPGANQGGTDNGGAGAWLTLTPASVDLQTYVGEEREFTVSAYGTKTFDKPIYVGVIDTKGVIDSRVSGAGSGNSYSLQLRSARTLAAGTHSSRLEVRLCEDDPLVCARPIQGSPWYVPVNIVVKSAEEGAKRVTWTPNPIQVTAYENESTTFKVEGRGNTSVAVVSAGAAGGSPAIAEGSATVLSSQYSATFKTSSTLALGVHDTTVSLTLCRDHSKPCTLPLAGSPWIVPVQVTVKPATNLVPLPVLSQVGGWTGLHGNVAHTSHVAASFDPSKFTRRWRLAQWRGPIALDNGMIFALNRNPQTNTFGVAAFSEETGARAWHTNLAVDGSNYSAPAVSEGKVFVTSSQNTGVISVYNQTTGAQLSQTSTAMGAEADVAPTVDQQDLYGTIFNGGGMSRFGAPSYVQVWNAAAPFVRSPSVDDTYVAGFANGTMYAFRKTDGAPVLELQEITGVSLRQPVILSGKKTAFVVDDNYRILAYDLVTKSRVWALGGVGGGIVGQLFSHPAYANDVLYFSYSGKVQARSALDGKLLWESEVLATSGQFESFREPLATDNLIFLRSDSSTIAVDIATRKVVWRFPAAGTLSISNRGVLYIQSPDSLTAINLQ